MLGSGCCPAMPAATIDPARSRTHRPRRSKPARDSRLWRSPRMAADQLRLHLGRHRVAALRAIQRDGPNRAVVRNQNRRIAQPALQLDSILVLRLLAPLIHGGAAAGSKSHRRHGSDHREAQPREGWRRTLSIRQSILRWGYCLPARPAQMGSRPVLRSAASNRLHPRLKGGTNSLCGFAAARANGRRSPPLDAPQTPRHRLPRSVQGTPLQQYPQAISGARPSQSIIGKLPIHCGYSTLHHKGFRRPSTDRPRHQARHRGTTRRFA